MKVPRILEKTVNELWGEELKSDPESTSSMNQVSSTFDAMSLAKHACANIEHKAFVGLFVPHNRILQILEEMTLFPDDALRHSKQKASKLTNKRGRNK